MTHLARQNVREKSDKAQVQDFNSSWFPTKTIGFKTMIIFKSQALQRQIKTHQMRN